MNLNANNIKQDASNVVRNVCRGARKAMNVTIDMLKHAEKSLEKYENPVKKTEKTEKNKLSGPPKL